MPNLVVSLDLTPIYLATEQVMQAAIARLSKAVEDVAINGVADWKDAVWKAKLWEGERQQYVDSISYRMVSPLKAEITADYRLADQIENGRPAYDLKQMLATSTKVRRNKNGQRFLIIPFRHNTPGQTAHATDMPGHVYAMAKKLQASSVSGTGMRRSGEIMGFVPGQGMQALPAAHQHANPYLSDPSTKGPAMVPSKKYLWGTRLAPGSMGPNPRGKVDRFAGMVRFNTTAEGSKAKSSAYMTFRVMSEKSSGWIIPARPGLKIAEGVTTKLLPQAQAEFLAALKGQI